MRALIKINLKNLKSNFLEIKNKTNKNIIAVLKDNAYGHDLIHVAKLLSILNVNMIALATFEEAISLRKNLIFTPILLFERCSYYRILSSYKIIKVSVKDKDSANAWLMNVMEINDDYYEAMTDAGKVLQDMQNFADGTVVDELVGIANNLLTAAQNTFNAINTIADTVNKVLDTVSNFVDDALGFLGKAAKFFS